MTGTWCKMGRRANCASSSLLQGFKLSLVVSVSESDVCPVMFRKISSASPRHDHYCASSLLSTRSTYIPCRLNSTQSQKLPSFAPSNENPLPRIPSFPKFRVVQKRLQPCAELRFFFFRQINKQVYRVPEYFQRSALK
jgi:hypothetical protein